MEKHEVTFYGDDATKAACGELIELGLTFTATQVGFTDPDGLSEWAISMSSARPNTVAYIEGLLQTLAERHNPTLPIRPCYPPGDWRGHV